MATGLSSLRTYRTRPDADTGLTGSDAHIHVLDDWGRLNRFLILGSEAATFSAFGKDTKALVADNAKAVTRCIETDGIRAVDEIVRVSAEGLAPKNDPALFALAIAASVGDEKVRAYALAALPKVARTGTHLQHFAAFCEQFRGWGRGLRRGIGNWFTSQEVGSLAYQAVKYQSRDGWSMRDLLRLSHPTPPTEQHNTLFHWITKGWESVGEQPHPDRALQVVWAFERLKRQQQAGKLTARETARFIRDYNLPREAVPTEQLSEKVVWEALLEGMPMTAMIRNLATMTRVGVIAPLSDGTRKVLDELGKPERIHKSRLHPLAILVALKQYSLGQGFRGSNTWTPVRPVVDALDAAFYTAFKNVTPSGKKWLLALDVSGSMDATGTVAGIETMNAREVSAAMALITAATEPQTYIVGFTSGSYGFSGYGSRSRQKSAANPGHPLSMDGLTILDISPRMRLDAVVESISNLNFGATDCSLPMRWAQKNKVEVDTFAVYTDSETNSGPAPAKSLREYRSAMQRDSRFIVVATQSTNFTVGDPADPGTLNVAGFDSGAPAVMSAFSAGRI